MRFTLHVALLRVTAALLRRGRAPALVALVVAGLLGVPEGASQHARGTAVDVAAPGFLAKRWTTADGLPVNHITSLHFAQDGYLWMTTFDGLVRFDGHRFTVFNTANSPNMTSNRLVALHEAPDGALWLRTEGGGLLRRADDRFEAFPGVEGATGSFFFQDADTLWMTATQGLFRYDPAAGLRQAYPHVIDEPVTDVIRDYAGALWVYGRRTLYRFDPHADASQPAAVHTFTAADGLPGVEGLLFNPFKPGVLFDAGSERDGPALWVGMPSGLVRWDGTRFEQPFADAPYWDDSHVMSIQSGPDGRIWFGTTRYGWLVYDGERLEMEVPSERTTPGFQGLGLAIAEDGAVWHTQQGWLYRDTTPVLRLERPGHLFFRPTAIDPEGNLWVGEDGLFRVQRRAVHTVSRDDGLPSDQVYPVLQARDGALWLGAWAVRGLTRWHEGAPTQYGLTEHDARAQDFTTALHEDAAGRLWVGTLGRMGHLAPTQPGGERFRVLDAPVDDVYLTHVSALHTDRAGYLWAGSERGVVRLRQTGGMPTEGIHEEGPGTWAATAFDLSVPVRRVEELRDGSVLVGTLGSGIGRYRSVASGRDAEVGHDAGAFEWLTTADGLASDFVRDLYEDAEGFLWIVTQDRGLCRLDRRAEASLRDAARAGGLACVDTRHGLFDNSLHRVLEDDAGRLWLSSNRGLFWATRADLDAALRGVRPSVAVVSYTERDGMRNREANGGRQPAGLRAADGRLWFPTQGGVVVVDPNEVAAPKPVPVRMETAVVGGATLPLSAGALTLPAGTRDLDVRYAGLAFGRPEAVRYRVRLDGYDAAWRAPTHSTTATYTNLPPGRYTLRVEASLGGAWSAPATLDITRPPRFWETGLFVLLAVALVGLAGVALFRQRVRHLTKRQAVLENTVEARTAQLRANEVRLAEQAAALRRADAVKTRFLANLTHEFRTPLTLTFGPLDDLLADRYATVDEARPVLRRARRQGERLLRLINQLLDLARMDAEGIRLRPEHGDLAAFLRHRVALFGSRLEERGLAVHLDLPEAPILHAFDPRLLETAVLNLLANAVKFTEPGGTITVGARTDALGTATVWIRDTGVGIAPEHLPHVFDRFYQADGSNTRQHEGSGIGLALVQEVAALHGGTVSAESELGVGTTFTLRLPRLTGVAQPDAGGAAPPLQVSESTPPPGAETRALAPEDRAGHEATTGANGTAQAPREAVPGADAPESERPVVLVVEDSPDLRAYLRSHLDATYDVIEATDGAEGVRLALEHVPDLVLSDVMMPLLDGFAVLATLKTDPRTSHVPIVLLTARADAESRQLGLGEGADDYLAKPFDMGEVLARIANLIAQRRQLRALWDPRRSAPDVAGDGTEQPADVAEPNGPGAETVTSTVTSTVTPTVVARETAFLARVEAIVAARMTEVAFGADALAVALHMSARQLRRKLQSVCGTSPAAFIQQVRLRAAVALVEQGELTMGEVAAAVGFASASTFRKAFGRVYGCTPTAYVNARLQEQDGKAEPSA